ncbi:MAG: AmmeMemoRadiSam system protein B [Planctomycetes bacterium]|nr:AmmeMemoRadiSam system protein B [Planctomycetota bacterium]
MKHNHVGVWLVLLSLLFALPSCARGQEKKDLSSYLRNDDAVAGRWYPADAAELKTMIDGFLAKAEKKKIPGQLIGLLSPHAGYVFSGPVAAWSYKQLIGRDIDTVVVLGLWHAYPGYGPLVSVFPGGRFRTVLGDVPIDTEMAQQITKANDCIGFDPGAHISEHSVANQVPFLQCVLKDFKIVPIVMVRCTKKEYKIVSDAVAKACQGKNVLLIAGSDLSHYPPYEEANRVDKATLESLKTFDPDYIMAEMRRLMGQRVPNLACTMCADDAVITMVMTARKLGANQAMLLHYANSGDAKEGQYGRDRVVGYGAMAFYAKEGAKPPAPPKREETKKSAALPPDPNPMSAEAETKLLNIARKVIVAAVKKEKIPTFSLDDPELQGKQGAFVTIKNHGRLRGCIGRFVADKPLYKVVAWAALQSSTHDYRFANDPITPGELKDIDIEISVLSPLSLINNPMNIELGKHGIYIVNDRWGRRGCYLPQVATETGWDKETFLSHCCAEKAGLPPDAWKKDPNTKVFVFTAHIIDEKKEKK